MLFIVAVLGACGFSGVFCLRIWVWLGDVLCWWIVGWTLGSWLVAVVVSCLYCVLLLACPALLQVNMLV